MARSAGGAGGARRGEYLGRSRDAPDGTGSNRGTGAGRSIRGSHAAAAAAGRPGAVQRGAARHGREVRTQGCSGAAGGSGGGALGAPPAWERRRHGVTSGRPLCGGGRAAPEAALSSQTPPRRRSLREQGGRGGLRGKRWLRRTAGSGDGSPSRLSGILYREP